MKYIPIDNKPNLSGTRFESISPSLRMDNRCYPHISWLDKKVGENEVRYSYWDGLKWAWLNLPKVDISEEEIVSSPNSLVLDGDQNPYIVYSKKDAIGATIFLSNYSSSSGKWVFDKLNVDYDVGWVGIERYEGGLNYSSSSSSSTSSIDSNSSSSSSSTNSSSSSSSSSGLYSSSSSSSLIKDISSSSSATTSSSSSSNSSSSSANSESDSTSSSSDIVLSSSTSSDLHSSSSSSSSSSLMYSSSSSSSGLYSSSSSSSNQYSSSSSTCSSSSSSNSSSSTSSESVGNTSSSSSSSSSYNDSLLFATVYDNTNSRFEIYGVTDALWRLIGSFDVVISDVSSIRQKLCGRKLGIAFINSDDEIQYNFFDLDLETWAFSSFDLINESNNVFDIALDGYNVEDTGTISVAWLSRTDDRFYVNNCLCDDKGNETYALLESRDINTVSTDSNYIINGYRKIAVSVDSSNLPRVFVSGATSKLFTLNGTWSNEFVDIEGIGNGIVPEYLSSAFCSSDDDIKITMATDSWDIYYFEPDSSGTTFPITTPDLAILNKKNLYHTNFSSGEFSGTAISDVTNNYVGDILYDTDKKVLVTSNKTGENIRNVDLNNDTVMSNRNVENIRTINSIDVNQVTGKYLVVEPYNADGSEGGAIVIHPQSTGIQVNETITLSNFQQTGDLYYPHDARFDWARGKIWIADTGNHRLIKVDANVENQGEIESLAEDILYPYALAVDFNNGGVFAKGYFRNNLTGSCVGYFGPDGVLLSKFEFEDGISLSSSSSSSSSDRGSNSTSSSSDVVLPDLGLPSVIDYDYVRGRCWWVHNAKIYMADVRNEQVEVYDLGSDGYLDTRSINIELDSGNALVVANDSHSRWISVEMNRDNNVVLATGYLNI